MTTKKFRIAVGDVHGMYDLLSPLVEVIRGHFNPTNAAFVFLGDLIDRGPRSRHVLRLVSEIMEEYESSTVILGNHDEYLRSFLDGSLSDEDGRRWSVSGGDETLVSYGFDHDDSDADILRMLRHKYPKHVEIIEGAAQMLITERHCFVHAGVDPTAGISEQDERTTRWIRDEFLNHTKPFEKIIVHGHTITKTKYPEIYPNRIALDSGSYETGRLSAAIFEDDHLEGFVCSEYSDGGVRIRSFDSTMNETRCGALKLA